MSMAVESRPQPGSVPSYEQQMRYPQPTFTNPWSSSGASPTATTAPAPAAAYHPPPMASRASSVSMPYAANPAASSLGSSEQLLDPRLAELSTHPYLDLVPTRSYEAQYPAAPASQGAYPAYPTPARHSPEGPHQSASPYGYEADVSRRSSYAPQDASRGSYNDALDASRGMLAMSQGQEMGGRQVYGGAAPGRQGSHDQYAFPNGHSHHSSISSASTYPSYYNGSYSGSVDGSSVTDYSSASDDPMGQRTLPAPTQLISGYPPEQGSMMTQFNSKMAPNAQKKHKCKICDKRFTRPSSLQTHMYSHTGEKPFACDHEGCGRHFSVVSNLRRHKKVHKDGGAQDVSHGDE